MRGTDRYIQRPHPENDQIESLFYGTIHLVCIHFFISTIRLDGFITLCAFINEVLGLFDGTRTDGCYFVHDIMYTATGLQVEILVSCRTLAYVVGLMSKSWDRIVSDHTSYRKCCCCDTDTSEAGSDGPRGYDTPAECHYKSRPDIAMIP